MRRVTRGPVLLVTSDPHAFESFWLNDYAPEVIATEMRRMPAIDVITKLLGGTSEVKDVPNPLDCRDGFNEAYYGRPEMLLEEDRRLSCSSWSFPEASRVERYVENLRHALRSGAWDEQYGKLRSQPWYSGSLRLTVSRAEAGVI
jgi:hypothetical protein